MKINIVVFVLPWEGRGGIVVEILKLEKYPEKVKDLWLTVSRGKKS